MKKLISCVSAVGRAVESEGTRGGSSEAGSNAGLRLVDQSVVHGV